MFSNNFKWAFLVVLLVLFGVLVKFDPFNWFGTYNVDQSMVAMVMTRKADAITELPEGTQYIVASGSSVVWEGRKVGGFHTGTLSVAEGVVVVSGDNVIGAEFVFDMNNITVSDIPTTDAGNAKLVDELKGFFNASEYPTGTFFLTSYENGQAEGDLTLNGVTQTISFPATITVSGQTVSIKANLFIQRSQWNLTQWGGMVQEELGISFDLIATTDAMVETTIATGDVVSGAMMSGSVDMLTGETLTGETLTGGIMMSGVVAN